MPKACENIDVGKINSENDRIIMKTFGLDYGKFFPQEQECER
jgi:hypothetical protein